jgi:hypothetical protein
MDGGRRRGGGVGGVVLRRDRITFGGVGPGGVERLAALRVEEEKVVLP